MSIKEEMLSKKTWAVVGVSGNKDKWGYKIYNILKENDYETFGVSPNYDELNGDKIYKTLTDLPKKVDVVDLVVAPKISLGILDEVKELGIEYIFFQPGSYNDEVVSKAEEMDLKILTGDCIYAILRNK